MSRGLIIIGLALVAAGLLWPWLSGLGLGRLPGDIVIEREHVRIYIPLVSGLLVSLALSLLVWLVNR